MQRGDVHFTICQNATIFLPCPNTQVRLKFRAKLKQTDLASGGPHINTRTQNHSAAVCNVAPTWLGKQAH